MQYQHNQLSYEIDDEWLAEAGAVGFVPGSESYRARPCDDDLLLVAFDSVEPLELRKTLKGIFCDDIEAGISARERVVRILRWLVADEALEPVKVVQLDEGSYKYRLVAGCHRFHCAHAIGYKKIPAVRGFNISSLEL